MKKTILIIPILMCLFAVSETYAQSLPVLPAPNHDIDHDAIITGTILVNEGEIPAGVVVILSRIEAGVPAVPVSYTLSNNLGGYTLTAKSGANYRISYQYPTAGFTLVSGSTSEIITAAAGGNVVVNNLVLERRKNTLTNCNIAAAQSTNWTGTINVDKPLPTNTASILESVSVYTSASASHPEITITADAGQSAIYSRLDIGATVNITDNNDVFTDIESSRAFAGTLAGQNDRRIIIPGGTSLNYYDISSARSSVTDLAPAPVSYQGNGVVAFDITADALTTLTQGGGNASFSIVTNAAASVCLTYTYASNPLPVTLASFSAKAKESENTKLVTIEWTTTMETNTDRFEIEKSVDAKNWNVIGNEAAAKESDKLKNYYFNDLKPAGGKSYYRLKMVDLDGSFAYSRIVGIQLKSNNGLVSLYPNPVADKLFVTTVDGEILKGVSVFNSVGQVILKSEAAFSDKSIDVRNLANGMYFVQIAHNDGTFYTHKLIINH